MLAASAPIAESTQTRDQEAAAAHFARSFSPALARAAAQKLVAYLNADGSYNVPSHSHPGSEHRVCWPEGATLYRQAVCDCDGYRATCCTHRAVAIAARKAGVHAKRPQVPALSEIEERGQQRTALQQRDSAWWADAQARVAAANERAEAIFDGQY